VESEHRGVSSGTLPGTIREAAEKGDLSKKMKEVEWFGRRLAVSVRDRPKPVNQRIENWPFNVCVCGGVGMAAFSKGGGALCGPVSDPVTNGPVVATD
jgi:hypothetical protein